jgi:hypothetical protein
MSAEPEPPTPRSRQLRLFDVANPLGTRLGAAFFRNLPTKPGVYFFYDGSGLLLYIGQSNDLRARVGSYRHVTPERHPKRTLRLVHRIARIEWQECETPLAALELERCLLLEKRPPFNRAGVWPGYAWWLTVASSSDHLEVRLTRHTTGDACLGPLPSGFRHALGSFMRCAYRLLHPDLPFSAYPTGLLNMGIPLSLRISAPGAGRLASSLSAFAIGGSAGCLADLASISQGASPLEQEYWTTEIEALQKFAAKPRHAMPTPLDFPVAAALPLFPEW